MKTLHLNIGANVNGKERFTLADVELACVRVGFYPIASRTAQSETEKTFALECEDKSANAKLAVKRLASLLQQDCTACIIEGNGELLGNDRAKVKEWGGKFLPLFWISVR